MDLPHVILFVLSAIVATSREERSHRIRRIVGGSPANYPPYDDPVVYTRFNGRSARVQGVREFPHYVFKGIKFACPPTGADRFLRPRQKFLEGDVEATAFAHPCVQPVPGKNTIVGSEDCLALNIFTPDLPTGAEGLPVIVWIHGGGFRYGSASQYGVRHLVGKRLVVVSIQYRLGSLGFLSSGTKHLPGNSALWDMALAVQWTRNYIGFFGGNPHRIVVMGHGTGASSAMLLALSKIAKGVPSGIIAMSGTAVSQWAIDKTPTDNAHKIAEQNGCPTTNPLVMVKCLQKIPAEAIIKGDSNIAFHKLQTGGFMSGLTGRLGTAPVSEGRNDGRSLPGLVEIDPVETLYKRDNPRIPLLTGVTKDETKKAVNGPFKDDIVRQLTSVPNFVDKVLVKGLQDTLPVNTLADVTGIVGIGAANGTGDILPPLNFENYLRVKKLGINEGLNTVAEVTADVLFNIPAFLTAQLWKGAPTFLYSFEHIGKLKSGSTFLQGVPMVGNGTIAETDNDTVAHGDELAYIFDANDLEGNPLPADNPTDDDVKVRNVFTEMIADFARRGEININNRKAPQFVGNENNYVQIKSEPVLANKFHFCEIALWTNIRERLKSVYCQVLKVSGVAGVSKSVLDQTKKLGDVGELAEGVNLGETGHSSNKNVLNLLGNVEQPKSVSNSQKIFNPLGAILG